MLLRLVVALGGMSQGAAGILAMAAGTLLILTVSVPRLRSRASQIINR